MYLVSKIQWKIAYKCFLFESIKSPVSQTFINQEKKFNENYIGESAKKNCKKERNIVMVRAKITYVKPISRKSV